MIRSVTRLGVGLINFTFRSASDRSCPPERTSVYRIVGKAAAVSHLEVGWEAAASFGSLFLSDVVQRFLQQLLGVEKRNLLIGCK